MNFEDILKERREAVIKSIHPITAAEAATMGESLFPSFNDPWRDLFFGFLAENPTASYHHADLPEGAQLLYSRSHNRGIWFVPGGGKGIIQENELKLLAEILAGAV